ncbi:Fic family protein [Candidatus Woesearchaeota archaeon]|nr:Fic family protein [Candidatus Woesearchaeota archaeon]
MTRLSTKIIQGKEYFYLEKPLRVCESVRNVSQYLGRKDELSKKEIEEATKRFNETIIEKEAELITTYWSKKTKFTFPLSDLEIKKIETMNLKYKEIIRTLHPKSLDDLNKRFIANYVFESNALEGNSLTLKNVAEIVFENRLSTGKDLREVYDAQNSYNLFLYLQKTRQELSPEFLIKIHSLLLKNIDDRTGYRTVPIVLVGKNVELPDPKDVPKKMDELLLWYKENEEKIYPLELAIRFHALFEKIHPFCDGNGRTGRFLMNYILIRKGYFPIIIRKTSRDRYIKSLEAADNEHWNKLIRFALDKCKETFEHFFEIYYKHNN